MKSCKINLHRETCINEFKVEWIDCRSAEGRGQLGVEQARASPHEAAEGVLCETRTRHYHIYLSASLYEIFMNPQNSSVANILS